MSIRTGKLTVFFEEPFWVGIFERVENGKLSVSKVTFGTEPKDYEIWEFVLKEYDRLRFSPSVEVTEKELTKNPKKLQREIQKLKCIPLKDNSQALKAGNAQYLKEVGVYVDQLQKTRPYSDNKCAAGAIENPIGKIGK